MKSVSEILTENGTRESWIQLIEVAAREVFELMLDCRLTVPVAAEETPAGVTAMVGLAGQLCGVLSIRCSGEAATRVTSRMLGVALDNVGPDVADALGEVCNMIAGNFKNKIAGLGNRSMLSPPSVITGTDYDLHSLAVSPALEVRLLFEGLPILVSLHVRHIHS
jgi:chemotaxis protein CheX